MESVRALSLVVLLSVACSQEEGEAGSSPD